VAIALDPTELRPPRDESMSKKQSKSWREKLADDKGLSKVVAMTGLLSKR